MTTVLLLARGIYEPEGTIHIVLAMTDSPWNYSVICEVDRKHGMQTVNHREGNVPTCLQCIAGLKNRYFDPY